MHRYTLWAIMDEVSTRFILPSDCFVDDLKERIHEKFLLKYIGSPFLSVWKVRPRSYL